MSRELLDHLGKVLMEKVRDVSVDEWDAILNHQAKAPGLQKVYSALERLTPDQLEVVKWLMPQVVDTVLHFTLTTLDEATGVDLAIKHGASSTQSIREVSDGLAGELYSERGWIARFSKRRHEPLE